jgi:hypothetical protein
MTDFAGPLHGIVLSRTLWTIVLFPLAGFVWHLAVARRSEARAGADPELARARAASREVGLLSVGAAAVATLAHLAVMVRSPAGPAVRLQPLLPGVRIGRLDASIDLWFDSLSGSACALSCLVSLAALAFLARRPPAERGWRTWAWVELSLAGALVSFCADGFAGLAIGWTLSAAAAAWLAGWCDERVGALVATRTGAGIGILLLAASLVFWGLGGRWEAMDYAPGTSPRYLATHGQGSAAYAAAPARPAGELDADGSITMVDRPGSRIYLDDARAVSLRVPFVRRPLSAGSHSVRIHAGPATEDATLNVAVGPDEDVELLPFGPSLSLRQIGKQLGLDPRANGSGDDDDVIAAQQDGLAQGPPSVATIAMVALLLAAAAVSAPMPAEGAPLALLAVSRSATTVLLGPFLLARAAPLGALTPSIGELTAAAGLAIVAGAGRRAIRRRGLDRWVALFGDAPAGFAWVALGLGGAALAGRVMLGAAAVVATSLLLFATRGRSDDPEVYLPPSGIDAAILEQTPEHIGSLVVRFERWVIQPVASAAAATVAVAAWVVAYGDAVLLHRPANAVARRLVGSARAASPFLGGSLGRVAWALVLLLGAAVLVHGLWPRH